MRLPAQGDNHGNLLAKIVENTFAGVTGGGIGPAGPQGPQGDTGPQGPQGPSGDLTPGIESLADATAIWLTAAEFVGIGTSAPDGLLHVFSGSAGTITPETFADDFVIENSTFVGMSLLCPNNTVGTIAFGDPENACVGCLNYNHSVDIFSFEIGGLEFIYFNGLGQMGIRAPAPDGTLHVMTASAGVVTASVFSDDLVIENNDHGGMSILTPNDKVGSISFGDTENNAVGIIAYNHAVDTLTFRAGAVDVVDMISTAFQPNADNAFTLGTGARRWSEIFAVTALINTSDAREKNSIVGISTELAMNLLDSITPRSYVWNSKSIPGTHYGFVAQEIEAAATAAGLDSSNFGPLHYDRESDRYGLREAELLPFLWKVVQDQQKRIQTLEYAYGQQ